MQVTVFRTSKFGTDCHVGINCDELTGNDLFIELRHK